MRNNEKNRISNFSSFIHTELLRSKHTKQSKNSDGARGYTSMVSPITLVNNGDRYNMVKVATIPWDIQRNIQFDCGLFQVLKNCSFCKLDY